MPTGKARGFKLRIDGTSTHDAWRLRWVHARQDQADLQAVWGAVMNIANTADATGAHILAYHKTVSERSRYEEAVRFRHRLVWLNHSCLYSQVAAEWWLDIEQRLRLEETWRENVRPSHHRHALILPSGTFASIRDPWTTAQRAETERAVSRAQSEIEAFDKCHRRQGGWRDERDLLFESRGPEHGQAPLGRRWKFTYQLSHGIHFDVRHERGRRFTLVDADGVRQSFRDYTNVDTHGHVRGGQ